MRELGGDLIESVNVIDRLLMSYCDIPDIRYIWTDDVRFLSQFQQGLTHFKVYSKYPPVQRDVSFWVNGK